MNKNMFNNQVSSTLILYIFVINWVFTGDVVAQCGVDTDKQLNQENIAKAILIAEIEREAYNVNGVKYPKTVLATIIDIKRRAILAVVPSIAVKDVGLLPKVRLRFSDSLVFDAEIKFQIAPELGIKVLRIEAPVDQDFNPKMTSAISLNTSEEAVGAASVWNISREHQKVKLQNVGSEVGIKNGMQFLGSPVVGADGRVSAIISRTQNRDAIATKIGVIKERINNDWYLPTTLWAAPRVFRTTPANISVAEALTLVIPNSPNDKAVQSFSTRTVKGLTIVRDDANCRDWMAWDQREMKYLCNPVNWDGLTIFEANQCVTTMNDFQIGGHDNWRLPTTSELLTLVSEKPYRVPGTSNQRFMDPVFPNFGADFWTSDSVSDGQWSGSPWMVCFSTAGVGVGGCPGPDIARRGQIAQFLVTRQI